jgi:excisionase family DNA binding protein
MSDAEFDQMFPGLKSRDSFPIREIATLLNSSERHVHSLVDEGCLAVLDPSLGKSQRRISSKALKEFLISRINQPKPKESS